MGAERQDEDERNHICPGAAGQRCQRLRYGLLFHEAYGLRSVAVAKGRLGATSNSRIVTVAVTEPRLEEDEVFVDTLIRFAGRYDRAVPCCWSPAGIIISSCSPATKTSCAPITASR